MENVKNLATHDNGNTLAVIKATMKELGYNFFKKLFRLLIMGFLKNENVFIWFVLEMI